METIYLVVGKKVVEARARIVGKIAEVQTPSGIIERSKWFVTADEATQSIIVPKQIRKRA